MRNKMEWFFHAALPAAIVVALILTAVPWLYGRASLQAKDRLVQRCLEAGKSVTWTAEFGILSNQVDVFCSDR